MFTNRFITVLIIVSLAAVVGLTVREAVSSELETAERIQQSWDADAARWEAMGQYYANQATAESYQSFKEAQPYIMDSATRSYIAWGQALQAAGKLDASGTCPDTTQENTFAGIPDRLDSATRSYIAWGLALQAKNDVGALCR